MSFEEMLKSLQKEYLSSIPEKIKVIEALISAGETHDIREAFHKLKGTGRTYGLPEVSEMAEVVEQICLEHPVNAARAAGTALSILRDIYSARNSQLTYTLSEDVRMQDIRKLLQK